MKSLLIKLSKVYYGKGILIDAHKKQTRVAITNDWVDGYEFEDSDKKQLKGNIYLGRISCVDHLYMVFVDFGNAAFNDPNWILCYKEDYKIEEEVRGIKEIHDDLENNDTSDEILILKMKMS